MMEDGLDDEDDDNDIPNCHHSDKLCLARLSLVNCFTRYLVHGITQKESSVLQSQLPLPAGVHRY